MDLAAAMEGNLQPHFSSEEQQFCVDLQDIGRAASSMSVTQEVGALHYENARASAWHADAAAKQAASLAKWVEVLYSEVHTLQAKVNELEDWKRSTLDLMSTLRQEHKRLRRRMPPPEEGEERPPDRTKSLPISLADHMEPGASGSSSKTPKKGKPVERPPPGLEHLEAGSGKQVRFGAAEERSPYAAATNGDDEQGTLTISHVHSSGTSPTSDMTTRSSVSMATDHDADTALEGVQVSEVQVQGAACQVAEWRIGRLSERLKGCMGRALVSSAFEAAGLEDLRLMVFPDSKEVAKAPRSKRQKELYAKKVSEGPLDGCLRLKVPDCPPPHVIEYCLKVGSVKKGPFRHNFMDSAVNGCLDFGMDWLQQVEADNSLTVAVEIMAAPGWKSAPGEGPLTD